MTESYVEKLARWYNTLNRWEWPDDLPNKPDGWENLSDIMRDGEKFLPNKYDLSMGIMRRIQEIVPHKELMRWHHVHNLNKTNNEFEEWWTGLS